MADQENSNGTTYTVVLIISASLSFTLLMAVVVPLLGPFFNIKQDINEHITSTLLAALTGVIYALLKLKDPPKI